jgi:FKBP-type peptidyl-prolyl cis-trans isomerase SlyD
MSDQLVTDGKYVSLTYSITDDQGNLLEQTDLPVGYIHGGHTELVGGMDRAVAGKQAGDRVELSVDPEDAFGPHYPSLTFTDDIANVPPELRHLGAEVQMQNDAGEVKTFYVTRIEKGRLTVDGNHPMAGKVLHFHIKIHEVRDPTREELAHDRASCATPLH